MRRRRRLPGGVRPVSPQRRSREGGRQRDQRSDRGRTRAQKVFQDHRSSSTTGIVVRRRRKVQVHNSRQQETHLWLFFEPSFSSSATVAGNGETRCTGPFAMSATVWPLRATAVTSAPFDTR